MEWFVIFAFFSKGEEHMSEKKHFLPRKQRKSSPEKGPGLQIKKGPTVFQSHDFSGGVDPFSFLGSKGPYLDVP